MKTSIALGLLLLVLLGRVFGAAPEKIGGNVYYESVAIGGGLTRSATSFALMLKSDGTFTSVFSVTTNFNGGPYVYQREDGTYSYAKVDDQTAELVLFNITQFNGVLKRTLKFGSDTSGTIPVVDPADLFTSGHVFRFAPPGAPPPLVNCSNRSFVRTSGIALTGFVVAGSGSRAVPEIRASGPSLAQFGVTDSLRNPTLTIYNAATNTVVGANDDWSPEDRSNAPGGSSGFTGRVEAIKRTGALVGAFSLVENSRDAAVILSLPPGAYIAQVSSAEADDSGQALIEVYLLP